jgi:hypothetical protein
MHFGTQMIPQLEVIFFQHQDGLIRTHNTFEQNIDLIVRMSVMNLSVSMADLTPVSTTIFNGMIPFSLIGTTIKLL